MVDTAVNCEPFVRPLCAPREAPLGAAPSQGGRSAASGRTTLVGNSAAHRRCRRHARPRGARFGIGAQVWPIAARIDWA
jgi:hypothetical protein